MRRIRRYRSLLVLGCLACSPVAAAAQAVPEQEPLPDRSTQMMVSGLLGGIVGAGLGAGVGVGLEAASGPCQEWCGLAGFALGAVAGTTAGTAFGVHTGNQRRGEYRAALLGSAVVAAGTVLLISQVPEGPTPRIALMLLIPLQVFAAMEGETRSMRRPPQ
ncbi:hypothetical protein BH23GEM9_BH23GEM9_01820 [soil metagenome]